MQPIYRILKRSIYFICIIGIIYFFIFSIYPRINTQINFLMISIATYVLVAYILMPICIFLFFKIKKQKYIPRTSYTWDGFAADPINIILFGTKEDLIYTFEKMGWYQADKISFKSSIKMMYAFLFEKEYLQAPFSSLYLFGKKQDIGFQQPIGHSPRKRHHVRFWNFDSGIDEEEIWIGSATTDIGFGFKEITYQLSHKIDEKIDEEREYVFQSLIEHNSVIEQKRIQSGEYFLGNKYKTDGAIDVATLKSKNEI